MDRFWKNFLLVLVALSLACSCFLVILNPLDEKPTTVKEIERYSVGMEIYKVEKNLKNDSIGYAMYARDNNHNAYFTVNERQFLQYHCGDIVEVAVIVYENSKGEQYNKYVLLGDLIAD